MALKPLLHLCLLFLIAQTVTAQDVSMALQKPVRKSTTEKIALWNQMANPLSAGFAGTADRFSHDLPPAKHTSASWKATAWKNEKVHEQILVSSKNGIRSLTYSIGNLKNEKGRTIGADAFLSGMVQYVMTDEFRDGCGYRKAADFDSSMVADLINSDVKKTSLKPQTSQAIWVSIHIPGNVDAGKYKGEITVRADTKEIVLPVEIDVIDRRLPDPHDWQYQLDLWQHPASVARVHDVALWSDEHFNLMRKYYSMLAAAGQKIITASIVDEPWNHQTYDDYPSLIRWIKKDDGSWYYDYTLFDKYIHFVMSCGITERINCYSMVPWKIAFKYYDEASGEDKVFTDAIGTSEYNAFWSRMLRDFTRHLKNKGWFSITAIAMDERPMKDMQAVIALLKTIDPEWKISLAGDYHPEIEKDIYDYCVASRWTFPAEVLAARQQAGKQSTWYTCCTEKYPNGFSFSPPDENAWLGWYTAATGMDGYLRWAYNSWPAKPFEDSRFTAWPAGDTYQVYPGPLTSIRFEKMIEGIKDYEKINILKAEYKASNDTQKLARLEAALSAFRIENLAKESAATMIERGKILLNDQ